MIILLTLISLGLVTAIIYSLRHYQAKALSDAAERDQPLPPLPVEESDSTETASALSCPPGDGEAVQTSGSAETAAPKILGDDNVNPTASRNPTTQAKAQSTSHLTTLLITQPTSTTSPEKPKTHWRERSTALKKAGNYEAAFTACSEGWPQWQSFQQGALVIRAALRSIDDIDKRADNTDWVAQTQREIWLERLFRTAAQASFLHDQIEGLPNLDWRALKTQFTQHEVEKLPMPWHQLGYKELKLLNQTDCQALTSLFDQPSAHLSAKTFHQHLWPRA